MIGAYVDCVGCEQRGLDAERVRAHLTANGYFITDDPLRASVAVIVTCAVDESRELESIECLRELSARTDKNCRLLVGGCLPSISPEALASFSVTGTFTPRSLESLDELIGGTRVPMSEVPDPCRTGADDATTRMIKPNTMREEYDLAKGGYKIRINHGCLLSCSYCVIRKATGRLKSVPEPEIVSAFESALQRQEPTIMLMGGDTGAYGLDMGTDFASLLRRLLVYDGTHRLFIHDFNINWLLRALPSLTEVLKTNSDRLRAASFPIQSGSDVVLKHMRRPYKAEDAIKALRSIRLKAPHVGLGTHIIVGFPGESDADFEKSVELIRAVDFDFVSCFRYSEHSTAPSASCEMKIPENLKRDRLDRLRNILGDRATIFS